MHTMMSVKIKRGWGRALALVVIAAAAVGCGERSSEVPDTVAGHCTYVSRFSDFNECNEFLGTGWTEEAMREACDANSAELVVGVGCDDKTHLGACILNGGTQEVQRSYVVESDAGYCSTNKRGCEVFAGGAWVPDELCGGEAQEVPQKSLRPAFVQPTLECRPPMEGEPAGAGENGEVCTWNAIAGATEVGRRFDDYASCETVLTQRFYAPAPPNGTPTEGDPRLEDPEYVTELEWVREQIDATACVCCHTQRVSPDGIPSNWYTDAPGNFMNTFYDSGLAIGAGWIKSTELGTYPAEENNGFDRTTAGIPTTDPERLIAFFEQELEHRGKTREDFAYRPYAAQVIQDQIEYEPQACAPGEGIDADGKIWWPPGRARYVYVLEEGSANPTVPPNLDKPEGTMWRIDVFHEDEPIESGTVTYGEVPDGLTQNIPESGAPAPLEEGKSYYLHIQEDVVVPISRCIFTYPIEAPEAAQ